MYNVYETLSEPPLNLIYAIRNFIQSSNNLIANSHHILIFCSWTQVISRPCHGRESHNERLCRVKASQAIIRTTQRPSSRGNHLFLILIISILTDQASPSPSQQYRSNATSTFAMQITALATALFTSVVSSTQTPLPSDRHLQGFRHARLHDYCACQTSTDLAIAESATQRVLDNSPNTYKWGMQPTSRLLQRPQKQAAKEREKANNGNSNRPKRQRNLVRSQQRTWAPFRRRVRKSSPCLSLPTFLEPVVNSPKC